MSYPPSGKPAGLLPAGLGKIFGLVVALVVIVVLLVSAGNMFEWLNASDIMVVQYPSGQLEVFTDPGIKPQWFGHTAKYAKRSQFWFSSKEDQGKKSDDAIKVRFNDAGHGFISGSIAWEMPLVKDMILEIYKKYPTQHALEQQLVRTVVEKAVYMTGPLMSSRESYAERRNDLLSLIEDQIAGGVYRTITVQTTAPDPITGIMKSVSVVQLQRDDRGLPLRQEKSPLTQFGIRTFNLSLNAIDYDETVEKQIKEQQAMTMAVQTAVVEAKKAEQAAITAQKNGEAEAAKAKWAQEVVKATEVTAAQKRLAVAELDAKAAEQTKRKLILEGEGEGGKRRAIMIADGALQQKLAAWVESQKYWADALKNTQNRVTPDIVWGGNGASAAPASGATTFMEIMGIRAAQQLNLDMSLPKGAQQSGSGSQK